MNVSTWMMLLLTTVFFVGCGGQDAYIKKGEVSKTIEHQMDQGKYFEAIGIGAADPELKDPTQRKATSRNAAIVQAQYELLSMIKGVQVEGGVTVQRAIETDSRLETRINEVIKGSEVVFSMNVFSAQKKIMNVTVVNTDVFVIRILYVKSVELKSLVP
jgi:hypothetical protein